METQDPLFITSEAGLGTLTAPTKPEKLSKLANSPSRKIGLVVIIIVLTVTIYHYRHVIDNIDQWLPSSASVPTRVSMTTPGTDGQALPLVLDDVDWHGVPNMDPTKRVHSEMATADEDVWTLTRLDHNPELVFTNPPAIWASKDPVKRPPSKFMEWMVMPGQAKHRAVRIVQYLPRLED